MENAWRETVGKLLEEVLEAPPEERDAFLRERCADAAVRAEVASLAEAYEEAPAFFERVAEAGVAPVLSAWREDEQEEDEIDRRASDPLALEGTRVGRYAIEAHLGGGGMGVVYRARDTQLGREVALKFLPPHLAAHPEAKARFVREARAASALDHPNIGTIHEIGETEADVGRASAGQRYIAMAYYDGETLKEKIAREGPLPVEEAVGYAMQIAEGLARAHGAGIIHRDVKPANVIVTEAGVVKIVDFGLARAAGQSDLTWTGQALGTAAYMSPEQARGAAIDSRTDLWALGAVLYEMLSGRRPFRGGRPEAVIYAILNEEPEPLSALRPEASSALAGVVARCLAKDPAERYLDAETLIEDLGAGEPSGANPGRLLRHVREPRFLVPAIITVLTVILASVWFVDRQAKVRWARQEALPEIERLVQASWRDYTEAYQLAEQAERYIPNDPELAALIAQSSFHIDIDSDPPGADVYMRAYDAPEREWRHVGRTPIDSIRVPRGIFRWKMEKEGYETVRAAASTWDVKASAGNLFIPSDLARTLDEKGSIPEGMVRVQGADTPHGTVDDFFIDRYEVTNEAYKAFIDSGGYRSRAYWQHAFVKDGRGLPWDEAMTAFVDQTDRPGPASWQAGDYPEGQGNYPVSGVSWYEAAAYCAFAGKRLPTGPHWGVARGEYTPWIQHFAFGGVRGGDGLQ